MTRIQNVGVVRQTDGRAVVLVSVEHHLHFLGNSSGSMEGLCNSLGSKVDGHKISWKSLSFPGVHQQISISEHAHLSPLHGLFLSQFLEIFVHLQSCVFISNGSFSLLIQNKQITCTDCYYDAADASLKVCKHKGIIIEHFFFTSTLTVM